MTKHVHGGNTAAFQAEYGMPPLDFSANVSPLGMPHSARKAAEEALTDAHAYPDPDCKTLREALAAKRGIPMEHILCGNGVSDLICRFVAAKKPVRALIPVPSFSEYETACCFYGCDVTRYVMREENGFLPGEDFPDEIKSDTDVLFLAQPNNPTGKTLPRDLLRRIVKRCDETGTLLMTDECFLPFLDEPGAHTLMGEYTSHRIMILRAFTKFYGMAGLRLGYAISADTALLKNMSEAGGPWAVSNVAQAAGVAALRDEAYEMRLRALIREQRVILSEELQEAGCRVIAGEANYLLFYHADKELQERLAWRGIAIRDCANFPGLDRGWYRVAVRAANENEQLVRAIREVQT